MNKGEISDKSIEKVAIEFCIEKGIAISGLKAAPAEIGYTRVFDLLTEFAKSLKMINPPQDEIIKMKEKLNEFGNRLNEGKYYLMNVIPAHITVDETLEAFGFTND